MNDKQTTNWLCEKCGEVRSSVHDGKLCAKVAELKEIIEKLKKRQLPEGWHVGKMRNGAITIPRLEGECYIVEAENTYEAWSVNGHNLSDSSRDIIEIDGVPTKAGEDER
jgi:hypothetical protein